MAIIGIVMLTVIILTAVLTWLLDRLSIVIIGLFCLIIAPIVTGCVLTSHIPENTAIMRQQDIVSIRDNSSTGGNIFVFGSTDYYTYYVRNSDGSYYQDRKPVSNTVIIEEDRTDGEVYEVWKVKDMTNMSWVYWGLGNGAQLQRTEFHIPKGSIVRQFVLDSQ